MYHHLSCIYNFVIFIICSKQIEELRQQLSSRTLTEILLSKALAEANEDKRKWKLEAALKSNELELTRSDRGQLDGKSTANVLMNINPKCPKGSEITKPHPQSHPEDNLLKYAKTSNLSKLKDIESLCTLVKVDFKQSETINLKEDIPCIDQTLIHNRKTGKMISTSDDSIKIESVFKEKMCLSSSHIVDQHSVVILDENSSDETVLSNRMKSTNTTDKENEDLIVVKEEIISQNLKLNSADKVEENKENVACDLENTNDDKGDSTKKVTFSANTISPKKSNLRKCKKIFVCKPVIFNSSTK